MRREEVRQGDERRSEERKGEGRKQGRVRSCRMNGLQLHTDRKDMYSDIR